MITKKTIRNEEITKLLLTEGEVIQILKDHFKDEYNHDDMDIDFECSHGGFFQTAEIKFTTLEFSETSDVGVE